jgi:hypothetical protein
VARASKQQSADLHPPDDDDTAWLSKTMPSPARPQAFPGTRGHGPATNRRSEMRVTPLGTPRACCNKF